MKHLFLTAMLVAGAFALQGCKDNMVRNSVHNAQTEHSESSNESKQETRSRPTNQVAVFTIWAGAEKIKHTALFYQDVLGLRSVVSGEDQYILDTDGSFLAIMKGQLDHPRDTNRRWPLFALSVPDLDNSLAALREAGVELPWGVEEFGTPEPSSRYVMFFDPAGNLIEIVEWL